jgi:hypothetical protein
MSRASPDECELVIEGTPVNLDAPRSAGALGIATAFEDLATP